MFRQKLLFSDSLLVKFIRRKYEVCFSYDPVFILKYIFSVIPHNSTSRSIFIRSLRDAASMARSKYPIVTKKYDEKYRIVEVICKWTRYLAWFCARLPIIIAAMIRRQVVSASSFFYSVFFAASALVRELERINEWHARPFLCSFAESSAASSQKVTRDETDFWHGSMGRDNAHDDLCIASILHDKYV